MYGKINAAEQNIPILISGQVQRGRGESGGNFCQFFKIVPSPLALPCFMSQPLTAAACNLTEFLSAVSCATETIP